MRVSILLILLVCFQASLGSKQKRYDGWKVIEVTPTTEEGVKVVEKMRRDSELDFWLERGGYQSSHIMIPPSRFNKVVLELVVSGVSYKILNHNVQENVDIERKNLLNKPKAFDLNNFNRYEDIINWLDNFSCGNGIFCVNQQLGETQEKRKLKLFQIGTFGSTGKPVVWIDSGIHAREWIAPATLLKIMNLMATSYGSDSVVTALLNKYDFYFVPLMNPDGYAYSWESERYWRKNRAIISGSDCRGTDLNRNFDTGRWASDGTSSDPCSDIYGGPNAGSEIETRLIQNYLQSVGGNSVAMISLHAYAYAWIHPYGHTNGGQCELPSNAAAISAAARAAATAATNVGGGPWKSGTVCETINYAASGGSMDYALAKAGFRYSFTPELRGQDFVIDASEIEPSYQETWAAIQAAIQSIESSQ